MRASRLVLAVVVVVAITGCYTKCSCGKDGQFKIEGRDVGVAQLQACAMACQSAKGENR